VGTESELRQTPRDDKAKATHALATVDHAERLVEAGEAG